MSKQAKKKMSDWVLVKASDLPVPSEQELEALRQEWLDRLVWFFVGDDKWRPGKVYAITKRGEVKIAVWRDEQWRHGRVICFEYIPRVLQHRASSGVGNGKPL
jgi:hypothetical protein